MNSDFKPEVGEMAAHNANNERIKRRYFVYLKEAMRQSEATVDQVAKALARFEADTGYREFRGGSTPRRRSRSRDGWPRRSASPAARS